MMPRFFWPEFGILFVAALFGGLAVMPYVLRLLEGSRKKKPLKMSIGALVFLAFLQTAILSAIAIGLGLLAAHATGLGAPLLDAMLVGRVTGPSVALIVQRGIVLGVLAGLFLLIADLFFLPHWPEVLLDTARKTTLWENFTASFYGGLNEEFLMRLFGLSVTAWLLSRIWHTPVGMPTGVVFWVANVIMAALFSVGHLPALKALVGTISPVMLTRTLLLNAPIGLICGWLFWYYGIEAAVIAHFSADIVYHVIGTVVLRRKLASAGTRPSVTVA